MTLVHELLGYKNIKIYQNEEMFRFSLDSTLLANFVEVDKKIKEIIDLGTGNAPIPLFLTFKTKALITGVEIQAEVAELARKSVEANNLSKQIRILNNDIKGIYQELGHSKFDIVISNPPYFKYKEESNVNKSDYLTIARHEVLITLEDIIKEAKKLIVDGGHLYIVHRVERLQEMLNLFEKYNFGAKKMQFVFPKKQDKNALLVLVCARFNKRPELVVESPLYIYNSKNEYTSEVRKIFNFKKER